MYAYHLDEGRIQRQSDDGEPKGTAGMPILEAIHQYDITDVVVTVRRDFGGILLGAGGLIRAYSKAAHLALKMSEILIPIPVYVIQMTLDYKAYDANQSHLNQYVSNLSTEFGIGVTVQGEIPIQKWDDFKDKLQSLLNAAPTIDIIEEKTTYQPSN